jgi:hypothetical protein
MTKQNSNESQRSKRDTNSKTNSSATKTERTVFCRIPFQTVRQIMHHNYFYL